MVFLDPVIGIKIVYILGITNVIGLLLVLSTCRCILMIGLLTQGLVKSKLYPIFYRYHCYFWIFFIISIILHAFVAFLTFGFPF
jgi:hypothetical protein